MSNKSIDDKAQELSQIRNLMRKPERTERETKRIKDFFGERDSVSIKYDERIKACGYDFIDIQNISREEAVQYLEARKNNIIKKSIV